MVRGAADPAARSGLGPVLFALFFLAGFGVSPVLIPDAVDAPSGPTFTYGASDVTAGYAAGSGLHGSRVVTVEVPYTYSEASPARLVLSLLVAEDSSFSRLAGSGNRELVFDGPSEGTTTVTARVRGGGIFAWSLSVHVIEGTAEPEEPESGVVRFRETGA